LANQIVIPARSGKPNFLVPVNYHLHKKAKVYFYNLAFDPFHSTGIVQYVFSVTFLHFFATQIREF
jgi:hypothetical protein